MSHPGDHELAALAQSTQDDPPSPASKHVAGCGVCNAKLESLRTISLEATYHSGEIALPGDFGTAASLDIGAQVGRYTILERIGSGGMGEVYAAYDPQLDRRVALKLLRPDRARRGGDGRARLLREAQAMARLSHPGVVAVHDVGVIGEEVFVAMEFVDGTTLGEWLSAQPRSVDEVIALFIEAGEGLAAAHDAGLVHRDFKPSNVLIGKDGRVRVVDFGLARTARVDGRTVDPVVLPNLPVDALGAPVLHTPLTHDGAIVGTPGYMAPEQLRGEVIDPRVDQFSFCAALYEGLYGRRPFEGATLRDLMQATLAGLDPDAHDEGRVPPRIHRTLARGLSPEMDQRFSDMRALLAELSPQQKRSRLTTGGWAIAISSLLAVVVTIAVVRARQPAQCANVASAMDEVWSPSKKAELASAFAATKKAFAPDAAAATALRLDDYARRWTTLRTDTCRAREQEQISESAAALRTACFELRLEETRSLVDLLVRADGDIAENAVAAVSRLRYPEGCLDPATALSNEKLPTEPAARGRIEALRAKVVAANAQLDSGKYREALDAAQPLVLEATVIGSHTLEAEAYYIAGVAEERLSLFVEAREHLNRSARAAIVARDDLLAARAWTQLVLVSGRALGDYPDAEQWADYAEAALTGTTRSPIAEAELAHQRGVMLLERSVYDGALSESKRALAIHEESIKVEDPQLVRILDNLAWTLSWLGDQEASDATYRRALEIALRLYGSEHPEVAQLLDRHASVLAEKDQIEEAISRSERALAIRERALVPFHPRLAESLNRLSLIYMQAGRRKDALAAANRAVEVARVAFSEDHAYFGSVLHTVGELALADGQYEVALEYFEKSEAISEAALGREATVRQFSVRGIGSAKLRLGHAKEAIPHLEEALSIYERVGIYEREIAITRMDLGRALWLAHVDRQRARALLHSALATFEKSGLRDAVMLAELDAFVKAHLVR